MKEISTTQVYYAYFNENKDAIKAYKVIDAVFNIATMKYTLTINVANEGVKQFVVAEWTFYVSPLDVVNINPLFRLVNLSSYVNSRWEWAYPYAKKFRDALIKDGFVFDRDNELVYYYFSGGTLKTKAERVYRFGSTTPLLVGTYNLLTNEIKGAQFSSRVTFGQKVYKNQQECLEAQMPKVVEFEEQSQNDAEISFNFNVSIMAKDAKDAQRKLALMLQMATEKVESLNIL